jgi:phenol 2-monooxygenase (NADPH)
VPEGDDGRIRATPLPAIIAKANDILHPYALDVKDVAWWSVYEVGHRVTDGFDDVDPGSARTPHVFICGDACHTHSAKAGQGMNVSMQDGFNLGWKLGSVLTGRAPESLLATYSAERQVIAQNLIDFDREWSTLMAKKPEEFDSPEELAAFYTRTAEFPAGFMTRYPPSMIVGEATHQDLASGFPIGKRLKSAPVVRIGDAVPAHLGHHARADGRWRIYAFADRDAVALAGWAQWLATASGSPVRRFTPEGADIDSVFDVKVVYPRPHADVEMSGIPPIFLPRVGPFGLVDYEKIYAVHPDADIFALRGIDPSGAVVVVRPDQYVAHVLPLEATTELADFFAQHMVPARESAPV